MKDDIFRHIFCNLQPLQKRTQRMLAASLSSASLARPRVTAQTRNKVRLVSSSFLRSRFCVEGLVVFSRPRLDKKSAKTSSRHRRHSMCAHKTTSFDVRAQNDASKCTRSASARIKASRGRAKRPVVRCRRGLSRERRAFEHRATKRSRVRVRLFC